MEKYVVLEKAVGETPLSAAERFRATRPDLLGIPLSYAGRLDPMASGKLLVLIGDECKHQSDYHGLDKEYEFSVLFGVASDTQDVLGRLETSLFQALLFASPTPPTPPSANSKTSNGMQQTIDPIQLTDVIHSLIGELTVPYPLFSAKTVHGKPLHMWTLEGRLDEIEIPTRTSRIYELELLLIETLTRTEVATRALEKIETIPEVTDPRKALGNDFRRTDVRSDWNEFKNNTSLPETNTIAHFRCVASSGSYMRTLATLIAEKLNTSGLAWSIHRTKIGVYDSATSSWSKEY